MSSYMNPDIYLLILSDTGTVYTKKGRIRTSIFSYCTNVRYCLGNFIFSLFLIVLKPDPYTYIPSFSFFLMVEMSMGDLMIFL